jgi:hypothetical protein
MNNLLDAIQAHKPLWAPLLVPSLAAAGGLTLFAWSVVSVFADTGFSW